MLMTTTYCAELTFKTLNSDQEFFIAKTLGSIALPGRVYACFEEAQGSTASFKFDFEHAGSVTDARDFIDTKFPERLDDESLAPSLAPPETILIAPALVTYCAELTFKALGDVQELFIATKLQCIALPGRTFINFDEPETQGSTASFKFDFEHEGSIADAHVFLAEQFPAAVDPEIVFVSSRIAPAFFTVPMVAAIDTGKEKSAELQVDVLTKPVLRLTNGTTSVIASDEKVRTVKDITIAKAKRSRGLDVSEETRRAVVIPHSGLLPTQLFPDSAIPADVAKIAAVVVGAAAMVWVLSTSVRFFEDFF